MAGTARIGGTRGLRRCSCGRSDGRSGKNPDDHRIVTSNDAKLDAKGRVGRPHARTRRNRWSDRSGRKSPWDRCAYNSRTDCKNRRPPEPLAPCCPPQMHTKLTETQQSGYAGPGIGSRPAGQSEPICLHRDETFWRVENHTAGSPMLIQHSGSSPNRPRGEQLRTWNGKGAPI